MNFDPYDELPYRSLSVEWSAPERLAVTSLLHGGPRTPTRRYRVLELGCANGANLLPLAYYRRDAEFVGVDGARSQIELATARRSELGLSNLEFVCADFREAAVNVSGKFDYILAHGIFSWIAPDVRDAVLEFCAARLHPHGLLYLNYNARPGWNVRGLVREFLLAQTAGMTSLLTRARQAQEVAAKLVASLADHEHAYSRLIADEFRFVCENHVSYVAHEYLATHNHAYWRSEFLALASGCGFAYVADADFNYRSAQVSEDLAQRLIDAQITGRSPDDTVDLLCYRQLHSPVFTPEPFTRTLPDATEFGQLIIASCLVPKATNAAGHVLFQHPSGYEVEAKEEIMASALAILEPLWPRGRRVAEVFPDVSRVTEDVRLLHRTGLLELRSVEPDDWGVSPDVLHRHERRWSGHVTSAYHTRECVSTDSEATDGLAEWAISERVSHAG